MTTNAPASILLCNARVILTERTIETANLLFEHGRIAAILNSSEPLPSASSLLDLTGMTLLPGFIDVHIHGAVGVDTMEAEADDLERVAKFLGSVGVTGWLPTLVPGPDDDYRRVAGE